MPAAVKKTKDELILEIKDKIVQIAGNDAGRPVNLDGVLINESGRSNGAGKISISCLFINEDGNVCADMYRAGSAGCVDFICGLALNSSSEKILKEIMSALDDKRWSIADYPEDEKQKKRNLVSAFKIPFLQKGA
jgi:hypothetical protein